jgi:hypothetical protein
MPTDKPDGSPLSDYQREAFARLDSWRDDTDSMAVDAEFSRATRGEKTLAEQRRDASYDEDPASPNSRESREREFAEMGSRAGRRAAGAEDEGDDTGDPGQVAEMAERIGLPGDVAAMLNPAAADVVADFGVLANDLHLDDSAVASIGEWLRDEATGGHGLPDASVTAASVARDLGIDPALLGSMSRADLGMVSRFASVARDIGLDAHQVGWLTRWASEQAGRVPEARGRGGEGGGDWRQTGVGIPKTISKSDVPRMSTQQLRALMASNFRLYEQVGGPAEYSRRLARGEG